MSESSVRPFRWSRFQYDRMIDAGMFHGERLELLDGSIVVREPQASPHFTGIRLVEDALRTAFGAGWDVRVQGPVALDDASEPEPDVAVVPGGPRDYRDAHPARPVLVVEVAGPSLEVDREVKAALYARGGLAECWIVNLVESILEVYRDPVADPSAPIGWRYATARRLGARDGVTPLAKPAARIPVADLLP
jgi:Uma2 family endonuclease